MLAKKAALNLVDQNYLADPTSALMACLLSASPPQLWSTTGSNSWSCFLVLLRPADGP